MKVVVRSKLQEGSRGLYRIWYSNGYIYCGSFVNDLVSSHPRVIAETYFGSSSVAKHYGWNRGVSKRAAHYNKSRIDVFEIWYLPDSKSHIQGSLEKRLIRYNAYKYGIADCALLLDRGKNEGFTSKFLPHGKVININCQDFVCAYTKAHQLLKAGKVSQAQRAHHEQLPAIGSSSRTAETFRKISSTKKGSHPRSHSCQIFMDGELYKNPTKAAEAMGNKNYAVSINRRVTAGLKEFPYRGRLFKVANCF